MASLPASLLQMKDRGLLLRGYKADIVIFDSNTVKDTATHLDSHKFSTGIEYVIVNGKLSIEEGQYNDSLNGKVLLLTENQ
jgi:N-acyl-D-aspartate/D-glutamate deacylase